MLGKKRVLAIAGVACILVASLSIVYVAASPAWTIDDMVNYMEKTGKAKIWKTCYLVTAIDEKIDYVVAHETLDIQITTISYDTTIYVDGGDFNLYSTGLGGGDKKSDVYVQVTFQGTPVDADVSAYIKDGGKYMWAGKSVYDVSYGVYDVYISAWSGLAAGSYLIQLQAYYSPHPGYGIWGTATYIINCWATTT